MGAERNTRSFEGRRDGGDGGGGGGGGGQRGRGEGRRSVTEGRC